MWDAKNLEVTNFTEANDLLKRDYCDGFEVEALTGRACGRTVFPSTRFLMTPLGT